MIFRSLEEMSRVVGIPASTLGKWHRDSGGAFAVGGGFCSKRLARWRKEREEAKAADEGALPEPRTWSERKTQIQAQMNELLLAQRRGEIILVEDLREYHARAAGHLREASKVLLRQFGNEAYAVIEAALEKIEKELEALGGERVDDGDETIEPTEDGE